MAQAAAGVVPSMMYGTAWKKEMTSDLVYNALRWGFRAIDTACQPCHYREDLVGEGVARALREGVVPHRGCLFLQTKFTSPNGHRPPHTTPYNIAQTLAAQIRESFEISLRNLQTDYLDSYVMHSPMDTIERTIDAWKVMESLARSPRQSDESSGRIRFLGLSNCYSLKTLRGVFEAATIKPSFVQNRFHQETGYDRGIRDFCEDNGIRYQSFWSLTANPRILGSPELRRIVNRRRNEQAEHWKNLDRLDKLSCEELPGGVDKTAKLGSILLGARGNTVMGELQTCGVAASCVETDAKARLERLAAVSLTQDEAASYARTFEFPFQTHSPISREQIFYRFLIDLGIIPLNGTTNEPHMQLDLEVVRADGSAVGGPLTPSEIAELSALLK